jgi:hypothetical protein
MMILRISICAKIFDIFFFYIPGKIIYQNLILEVIEYLNDTILLLINSIYPPQFSAQTTIIEYHRLEGLNNRNLFLTFLEARTSRLKWHQDWVSGEDFLPCL